MKEIDQYSAVYYRDKFLEENNLNLSDSIDFYPNMIDELLSKYNGECEYFEQCYCCHGMDRSCWTEAHFDGNFGSTKESVIENLKYYIEIYGESICGVGRVFRKDNDGSTTLYIFARDIECQQDIIIDFGKNTF